MKERTPINNPISDYPVYFSLFQGKPIFLSNVETPMLKGAVERLLEAKIVVGIPVKKLDGTRDQIVRLKELKKFIGSK